MGDYDTWLTTPPDEPDPVANCCYCQADLFLYETIIEHDTEIYCSEECLIGGLKKSREITFKKLEEVAGI